MAVDSIDTVTVNGVAQTLGVHYTQDLTAGTITFATKPPLGVNNVIVTWTKTTAGDRDMMNNTITVGFTLRGFGYLEIPIIRTVASQAV